LTKTAAGRSTTGAPITADNLPHDRAALKRIIAAMAQDALVAQAEIARAEIPIGAISTGRVRPLLGEAGA
jgi:hypothetical protein